MKKYMDELYARLEELSEKPLTLGRIEEADAVAGLLCRLHKLDGMGGDHFRESTKMMEFSREDAMHWAKRTAERESERAEIEMWMQRMKNEDPHKPTGPMWSETECLAVASSAGIDLSGIPGYVFWAAMNMKWSDEWSVARDFGVDQPLYYARQAEAFLRDKDGPGPVEKLCAYYRYIASRSR